ncbi:hypothetical protein D3C78_843080 [compost metagenome]
MPGFMTSAEHKCCRPDRRTDPAVFKQLNSCLNTASKECIRRAANKQPLLLSKCQYLACLLACYSKRLLYIHMLASLQRLQANSRMSLWNRQINNQLNVWISEQLFDGAAANAEFLASCLGSVNVQVCASYHLQRVEPITVFQINAAYIACSNDTCFDLVHTRMSLAPNPVIVDYLLNNDD